MISFNDRVHGVLLGTAFGDALGAPVEGLAHDEIARRYGTVDSLNVEWHKAHLSDSERRNRTRGNGIVTDDTLMTFALVRVYERLRRHVDSFDFADEFLKEFAFRPTYVPEFGREALIMDRLFYPEQYPFIRLFLASWDPRSAGTGNMVNCGAAMYIAPVGVVNAGDPKAAYDEAIAFASAHQSSYGLEAAGVLAACVAAAFNPDVGPEGVVRVALELAKDGTHEAIRSVTDVAREIRGRMRSGGTAGAVDAGALDSGEVDAGPADAGAVDAVEVARRFHSVLERYSPMRDDRSRGIENVGRAVDNYAPSRRLSIEELPMALGYILLYDGDFYPAVIAAINSGRDTDSIGAMVGGILGAMHGNEMVTASDAAQIDRVNRLDLTEVAPRFATTARHIIREDLARTSERKHTLDRIGLAREAAESGAAAAQSKEPAQSRQSAE